jgi:hypothetical protein
MQLYCRKSILLHEMNYICNNFIFTIVNNFLLKFAFLRNVLKKLALHIANLVYFILLEVTNARKNWLLVTSHDQEP